MLIQIVPPPVPPPPPPGLSIDTTSVYLLLTGIVFGVYFLKRKKPLIRKKSIL